MDRRDFLRKSLPATAALTGAGPLIIPQISVAQDLLEADLNKYDFLLPTVKFHSHDTRDDRWNYYPGALRNLLLELSAVIRCKIKEPQGCHNNTPRWGHEGHFNVVVTLDTIEQVEKFPFLFMNGEGTYDLDKTQRAVLKQYLLQGGFILMDDCIKGNTGDFFYQSSYKILNEIFGEGAVKRIPNQHEVYNNVYDLRKTGLPLAIGHGKNHGGQGVWIGDRLAVFLSSTDIHCGWQHRGPGYTESIQLGINLIVYALTH